MEVVDLCFCGFDLLGRDLAIGGEEVGHEGKDTVGVLAGSSIEKGAEINGVNGIDNLGNKGLFSGLVELKLLVAFKPHATSYIDGGWWGWRREGTRIDRCDPGSGWL